MKKYASRAAGIVFMATAIGTYAFFSKQMEKYALTPPAKDTLAVVMPAASATKIEPKARQAGKSGEKAQIIETGTGFGKTTIAGVKNYLCRHDFNAREVESLLSDPRIKKQDLRVPKPDTARGKMDYARYRALFKPEKLASRGAKLYRADQAYIDSKEAEGGAPKALCLSHYGMESFYGDSTGHHAAVNVFLTRIETSPRRAAFALKELAALLRLCKKYNADPLEIMGSHWGAINREQAMPTSLESFDRRHPCGTFAELISERNSLAFIFDYLALSGATNKHGYGVPTAKDSAAHMEHGAQFANYWAAFEYNHSPWYARLAMEISGRIEKELAREAALAKKL